MSNISIFDERKSAQAAAFMLHMAGGELPLIKLMKLMYLAERLSLKKFGESITSDSFVAMKYGPALWETYQCMTDGGSVKKDGWSSWIRDEAERHLSLEDRSRIKSPKESLLALSEINLECLGEVWDEFGHMSKEALVEYTHTAACSEWSDPKGDIVPIPLGSVLKAIGYPAHAVEVLVNRVEEQKVISAGGVRIFV